MLPIKRLIMHGGLCFSIPLGGKKENLKAFLKIQLDSNRIEQQIWQIHTKASVKSYFRCHLVYFIK